MSDETGATPDSERTRDSGRKPLVVDQLNALNPIPEPLAMDRDDRGDRLQGKFTVYLNIERVSVNWRDRKYSTYQVVENKVGPDPRHCMKQRAVSWRRSPFFRANDDGYKAAKEWAAQQDPPIQIGYGHRTENARIMLPFFDLMTHLPGLIVGVAPIPTPYGAKESVAKSLLMKVMQRMTKEPSEYLVNLTKGIWMDMPLISTMFVEEAQDVYQNKPLQRLLDASYRYGQKIRRRNKPISIWCFKMMAMLHLGGIPKAAWTRHIPFLMMTKYGHELVDDLTTDDEEFDDIRRKCERWARMISSHYIITRTT